MYRSNHTAIAIAAAIGMAFLPSAASAGNSVGAGLLGFGVGAIVGSALTPREVYVVPPPPPPSVYLRSGCLVQNRGAPVGLNTAAGTMDRPFNPRTGYFQAADGGWYSLRVGVPIL